MRGAWLVGVALCTAVLGACGSPSPTKAQIEAERQWIFGHEDVEERSFDAFQALDAHLGSLKNVDCQQLATAATDGLATPPMPIASLETLWRSWLLGLRPLARACSEDSESKVVANVRLEVTTLGDLIQMANRLPEELHQLEKG